MLSRPPRLRLAGVASCTLLVGALGAAASTSGVRIFAQAPEAKGAAPTEKSPPPAADAAKPVDQTPADPKPAPVDKPEPPTTADAKASAPADKEKPAGEKLEPKVKQNPAEVKAPPAKPIVPETAGPALPEAAPWVAALETALGQLEQRIAASGDVPGWRRYFEWPALTEAASHWKSFKPTRAELALADRIAARLARDLPELKDPLYAHVRSALVAAAGASCSKEECPDELRAACERRRDPKPDLDAAKAALVADAEKLIARLRPLPVGEAWFKQLDLPALVAELAAKEPDLGFLREIEVAFSDGTVGLEWQPFVDLRRRLTRYRGLLEANTGPAPEEMFKAKLQLLADLVARRADDLSVEDRQTLNETFQWLDRSEQVPSLLSPLRRRYMAPNLRLAVRERFLQAVVDQPIDQVGPVCEEILGTRIVGTGRTVGRMSIKVSPDPTRLAADLTIDGTNYSRARGYNGPVVAHTTGVTRLQGVQRLYFDGDQLLAGAVSGSASASSTICGFDVNLPFARRLVARIAADRAAQQKPLAEQIAGEKARRRFLGQLETQFAEGSRRFDDEFEHRFRTPLTRVNLPEPELRLHATNDAWWIQAVLLQGNQLAASEAPEEHEPESMLAFQIHDTMIHNLTSQLAGRQIDEQEVRGDLQKVLPPSATQPDPEEDPAPGSILFAMERPVTVKCEGDLATIVMRTDGFTRGEQGTREYREFDEALTITARYRVEQTPDGLKFKREGKIDVLPTGFQAGKDTLPLGQTITIKLMEKLVGKFLKPEVEPEGIELVGRNGRRIGKLRVEKFSPRGPWLTLGMKLIPSAPAPNQAD